MLFLIIVLKEITLTFIFKYFLIFKSFLTQDNIANANISIVSTDL